MAVMEQGRFRFRGVGVFGVVVEGAAGDAWGGRAEGLVGGHAPDVGGVVLGGAPGRARQGCGRARTTAGEQGVMRSSG